MMLDRNVACALCACSLLVGARADAQEEPIRLEVEGPVDASVLVDALAQDLGASVVLEGNVPRVLRIRVDANGRAELTWSEPEDVERTREVELPVDPNERVQVLVLIGANLVRDPTRSLIAPEEAAPPAETETTPPESHESNLALARPFHLGASIIAGASSIDGEVSAFGYYGLDMSYTIDRHVTLGIGRLSIGGGFSSVESFILGVQATPYVEVFAFPDPRLQVYGQVGIALQGRTSAINAGYFQSAAFLGAGLRWWPLDWMSVGLEIGVHLVMTDAFLMWTTPLPQLSVVGTVGLGVQFHF